MAEQNKQLKHTPAPWKYKQDACNREGKIYHERWYCEEHFVDEDICDFGDSEPYENVSGWAPEEADLRVILASPDMLTLLKDCVEMLDIAMGYDGDGDVFGVHHNDAVDILAKAEALIIKVEEVEEVENGEEC